MKKLNILFVSSDFPKEKDSSNIYTDLAESLHEEGHNIKVVITEERKKIENTTLSKERGIDVLRVKTGNIYEIGLYEKAISFITISGILKRNIKKYFGKEKFDLVITSTPPITFDSVIKWCKKYYKCKTYLMLKDIFPQNAVDLNMFSKKSPIYLYFRNKERRLYKNCSYIGCMSEGNMEYLKKHNKYIKDSVVELFPNSVKIFPKKEQTAEDKNKIRQKYNISKDDIVAVYGGNFGVPQGLDFFQEVMNEYKDNDKIRFLLIGRGTEKKKVYKYIDDNNITNAIKLDYIPRSDYEHLLEACDIGLIFLDKRFTIPNFPSKTLSYFECSLPIMAAIDKNTDYGEMLTKSNSGFWVESGDIKAYKEKFDKLLADKQTRVNMGINGRKYYEDNYDVKLSVKILEEKGFDENEK